MQSIGPRLVCKTDDKVYACVKDTLLVHGLGDQKKLYVARKLYIGRGEFEISISAASAQELAKAVNMAVAYLVDTERIKPEDFAAKLEEDRQRREQNKKRKTLQQQTKKTTEGGEGKTEEEENDENRKPPEPKRMEVDPAAAAAST